MSTPVQHSILKLRAPGGALIEGGGATTFAPPHGCMFDSVSYWHWYKVDGGAVIGPPGGCLWFHSAFDTCSIGCGTQPSERRAATAVAVWGLHPVTTSAQPHSDCHCGACRKELYYVCPARGDGGCCDRKGVWTLCCTQAVQQQAPAVG